MKNKKFFLVIGWLMILLPCALMEANAQVMRSEWRRDAADVANVTDAPVTLVKEMTSQMFKDRVIDYTIYKSQWKFAGMRPAIIYFYATWCGPCKRMSKTVGNVAGKYGSRIDFYQVDIDVQGDLATALGIRGVPAVLFVPKWGSSDMHKGVLKEKQFEHSIEQLLARKQGDK